MRTRNAIETHSRFFSKGNTMPYIKVDTNVAVPEAKASTLAARLSAAVSKASGTPEQYVQAAVVGGVAMVMAGSADPNAHVSYKAIGLPEEKAKPLSAAIAGVLAEELGIPAARVYVSFDAYKGTMWGVGGGTFA